MPYQFKNISILVVEESQEMLVLIKDVLKAFGIERVYGALDADKGFDLFCKEDPDIVIAEWMMRTSNGIELTHKIRKDPASPNPYVPIIFMTGFSQEKRVITARDSGITEFLVKPFTSHTLYRRLFQVIERPRQFVKLPEFFGPDRRRKDPADHVGPERREDQQKVKRTLKAHEVVRQMNLKAEQNKDKDQA